MRELSATIIGACLLAAASPASAAADPQVWQGTAFITKVTTACTTANVAAAGDYYTLIYRPIILGSPANTGNEGLTFVSQRNAQHYFTPTNSNQSFRSAGTASITIVNSRAQGGTNTGAYSLAFSPANPTLTSPSIYLSGNLANFWTTKGCTVTLTASLDRRFD